MKWHWAQPLFATFVLLAILAFWWSAVIYTNGPESSEEISLGAFLPMMLQMILLALLAAVSLPDTIPEDGLDLADYYQENRVYQWSLFVAYFGLIHANFVVATARRATSIADMWVVVPDTIVVSLFTLMIFARKWWQVALGFAVFSFVPIVWATRLIIG
ncbi:MAG: hypothetical protein AAFR88_00585 [Pseudomonadota bacterium]